MAQALYYNGTIITVNDAQPLAEALLVEGETIKAVGTLAEVEAQAAPGSGACRSGRQSDDTRVYRWTQPHGVQLSFPTF